MSGGRQSILITGATSGIGHALARAYAAAGVHLALIGRDLERLDSIAALCRDRGAEVSSAALDVRDRAEIADWIRRCDDRHPIELAVASAGITSGIGLGRPLENPDAARAVIATNFIGSLNTVDPLIERMCERGQGQIAFVSSIAAVRGLPYSPAYCASKAAIHAYAEALRPSLRRQGVQVSLIVPGFVDTALNREHESPKPMLVSDRDAAHAIRRGLDSGAAVIAFPRSLYMGALMLRLLPVRLVDYWLDRIDVDVPETGERVTFDRQSRP